MNDDDRTFCESFTTTVMILPKNFLLVNHYPQQNKLCRLSSSESILSFIGRNKINFVNSHDLNHHFIHEKFTLQENISSDNFNVD